MKRVFPLLFCLMLLSSCGDIFDFSSAPVMPTEVTLSRHEVDIQLGDSLVLSAQVTPDTALYDVFWFAGSPGVLQMTGDHIYAVGTGDVMVYAKALSATELADSTRQANAVIDSCLVHVFDWQSPSEGEGGYDMVLYCRLVIDGVDILTQSQAEQEDLILAASINGRVSGIGQVMSDYGQPYYMLRIWSQDGRPDPIALECYSHSRVCRIALDQTLFFDVDTHGTLSNPLILTGSFL